MATRKQFSQDGAFFYEEGSGAVIGHYPELFDYECDFVGALLAGLAFQVEHPEYERSPWP
jgi:hypothetical protein